MILGIGSDVVNIRRIQQALLRFGERFLMRVFTQEERQGAERLSAEASRFAYFARRFAAKEACAKALATGFQDGVRLADIGVITARYGKPELVLTGEARERLHRLCPAGMKPVAHVSLSDDDPVAMAVVVLAGVAIPPEERE